MTKPLRKAVDVSAIVAAIALAGILIWHFTGEMRRERDVQAVRESLRSFETTIAMHAAAKDTSLTKNGWPATIEAFWFNNGPPLNILLGPERPWVEVATPEEAHLRDPNARVASDFRTAGFWYNPYLGIIRARVPYEINDENARVLYNQINGTNVTSIYGTAVAKFEDVPYGPPAELANTPLEGTKSSPNN